MDRDKLRGVAWFGALCAFLAGLAIAAVVGEEAATDFLRFVEEGPGEGRLEAAIVTYAGKYAGKDIEVDLIAAVHVADADFYKALQKRFEKYDALLYEMIKERGAEPVPGERSDNLLSAFQRGLKDVLALEFQLDAIDYSKRNFVHADMDPETFFRLQREKGENILTLMFRAMTVQFAREASGEKKSAGLLEILLAFASEDSAGALKFLLAREMEDMELLIAGFEGGDESKGSVIVAERNKVAMRVMRAALKEGKTRIGIFYGGGHMPGLEKHLLSDLGLRKSKTEWAVAWNIRKKSTKPAGEKAMGQGGEDQRTGEKQREF